MSNKITGDVIYGLVNQQGIFVGSATESTNGLNDLFIAAPLSTPVPTAATFKGSYTLSYLNVGSSNGSPQTTLLPCCR